MTQSGHGILLHRRAELLDAGLVKHSMLFGQVESRNDIGVKQVATDLVLVHLVSEFDQAIPVP